MRVASTTCLVALLCGTSAAPAQTPLTTVRVASGLSRPLDVQAPPGDRHRIFIVEQAGAIKIVKRGQLLATPFLTFTSQQVLCCGERGLLGLAFHPAYASNGYFFVNFTNSSGATMVERYTVSATNPDIADPNSRKVVIGPIAQPYSNHNGGCIQFGPDGYLYIGMGDGGSGGDPSCNAQNGTSLLGKMLRIDVDTNTAGYVIPPTNPFVSNTAFRGEVWAYGLRNPWRFSFDLENGDLYIGDVGQNALEEIDFQPGTSKGGENYGWKIMEGTNCYSTAACTSPPACRATTLVNPIHEYTRTTGRSITGGHVYRGCAIPDLDGTYFFGDYETQRIWSFKFTGGNVTEFKDRTLELAWTGGVSSFGVDACGEIYICQYATPSGAVYKIVPAAAPPAIDLGYGKVGGSGLVPEFVACGLLTSGSSAEFTLYDAPSGSVSLLLLASASAPTPLFGGTIVPVVPNYGEVLLPTDKDGRVLIKAPGGGGPISVFGQFLVLDPKASFGIGISNALRIDIGR